VNASRCTHWLSLHGTTFDCDLTLGHDGKHAHYASPRGVWLAVSGSATVRAWGSATVEAWGSATVRAWGSATVLDDKIKARSCRVLHEVDRHGREVSA